MTLADLLNVFQWWATLFFIGVIFVPITSTIFPSFFDKGYVFAKIIGIAFISYAVFILGFLKILPFETQNVFLIVGIFILINLFVLQKTSLPTIKLKSMLPMFILEEFMVILILLLWSFIHAHQPEIHGLEKYMDYGFINSILRAEYFPPLDMWFTPYSINYYYFGHLVTAVLTKLSYLPSAITFNLMLATIAAISFTSAFSIAANLLSKLNAKRYTLYAGGLLTAFLLNFAGNLHTIYLFFKPYQNENPVPFWNLIFSPLTFPNNYWYPNATRFIHNTIHEFPIYSYVVSDLHGHVIDIPFVFLTIAVLLSLFLRVKLEIKNSKLEIILISFLLAIMYMTNAWDGIIYLLLATIVIFIIQLRSGNKKYIPHIIYYILLTLVGFFLFTLPFNTNFKPFASGIGILCAPKFLTDTGNFGPLLFEPNHCQRSPLWQLGILYGFFYFWAISFFVFLLKKTKIIQNSKLKIKSHNSKFKIFNFKPQFLTFNFSLLTESDIFVGILIILSTILIIIPEFIYVKDIYPAHYRANTMFKLVYQSFIMLSLSSGYIIIRIITNFKFRILNFKLVYWIIGLLLFIMVSLYSYFSINSYFGNLKIYSGINGTNYLKSLYPDDYEAILWINNNIKGQPVILEAQGDSYTDYGRVSTNTGLPTVLGWTVHEWLWRGTYDIPAPRIGDVQRLYESNDINETKNLLEKYKVEYIFIGALEKQKYPNLNEEKFQSLGEIVYRKNNTKIYKININ